MRMSRKHSVGRSASACSTRLLAVAGQGHHLQLGPQRWPGRRAAPRPAAARLRRSARWGGHRRQRQADARQRAAARGRPAAPGWRGCRTACASRSRTCCSPKRVSPCRRRRCPGRRRCRARSAPACRRRAGADLDAAAGDLGLQAVLDAVFHQRLQQQRRHGRRRAARRAATAASAAAGPCARPSRPGSRRCARTRWPAGACVLREASSVARRKAISRSSMAWARGGSMRDQHAQVGQRVEQHVRLELRLAAASAGSRRRRGGPPRRRRAHAPAAPAATGSAPRWPTPAASAARSCRCRCRQRATGRGCDRR